MDSDDEFDDSRLGVGVPETERYQSDDSKRLPMKLYVQEIDSVTSAYHMTGDDPTVETIEQERNLLWLYHQKRLFETLKGYHKGDCDLTGRFPTRYERLRQRLSALSDEFNILLPRATLVTSEETLYGGYRHTWSDYEFYSPDDEAWNAFSQRWHVPFGSAYSLKSSLDEWHLCLEEFPHPRFQQVKLMDMPVEILENIVRQYDKSLKSLSATCRTLRDVALPEVYTDCRLSFSAFDRETDWDQAAQRDDNGISPYLRNLVARHQIKLLRRMDALRQHPYALDRTKNMTFYDEWTSDSGSRGYDGFVSVTGRLAEELVLPILSRLCFFIFRCPLETLYYRSHDFIGVIWDAVRSNPTLRTLMISARVQEYPAYYWLPAPSLVNLNLQLQNGLALRMWDIVPLCPNLSYLSFASHEARASRIPAHIVTSPNNMFRTLTRVFFSGVHARSVPIIIQAINAAADACAPRPLPLIHFCLAVTSSLLKRDTLFELTETLGRARIRVLCLYNLHYARPNLLRTIAARMPSMEALTLIHQQRHRYNHEHRVDWPAPAYEYALALRDFPNLFFLGFNNNLSPFGVYSPLHLTQCEDSYANAEQNMKDAWDEWFKRPVHSQLEERPQDVAFHPNDRDDFEDSRSTGRLLPRLFAIHCPTLRLLHEKYEAWAFRRHPDGKITALRAFTGECTPAEQGDVIAMYDTRDDPASWNL